MRYHRPRRQNLHNHYRLAALVGFLIQSAGLYRRASGFQSYLLPYTSVRTTTRSSFVVQTELLVAAASSIASDFGKDNDNVNNVTLLTSLLSDEGDADQDMIDQKKQQQQERLERQHQQQAVGESSSSFATTYRVSLPFSGLSGLSIVEVGPAISRRGAVSSRVVKLDLATLEISELEDIASASANDTTTTLTSTTTPSVLSRDELIILLEDGIRPSSSSASLNNRGCLVVASVDPTSLAWERGIRPGHVLQAMSATLGEYRLWPKSTLEGVRSALLSRRMTTSFVEMELRQPKRRVDASATASATQSQQLQAVNQQQYELTLTRPIGLVLKETPDGYVTVAGFTDHAPTLVRHAVRVGDRVLAVDSSVNIGRLWPVSTVEGVISACTSRLPGQTIQMRFERLSTGTAAAATVVTKDVERELVVVPEKSSSAAVTPTTTGNKQLLKRCRDVLRRFTMVQNEGEQGNLLPLAVLNKFRGKYALPARVADKVADALAGANAAIDGVTLSMIMDAYLSCRQPEGALRIFEAATGFSADASLNPPLGYHQPTLTSTSSSSSVGNKDKTHDNMKKGIVPNEEALNLYTGTSLLKAHALRGDLASVQRVMAALEGRSGVVFGGGDEFLESAPWPWTGTFGSIRLDTQFYNVVMAAAEKIGGPKASEVALHVFNDRLAEPSSSVSTSAKTTKTTMPIRPPKDVVSFNTLISILSNEGRSDEAFRLLDQMKRAGIRPDKFTYTSLIKACTNNQDDIEEMLYDMRELGVAPDCVTYNTMIKSLCESRRWKQATRLITEMESRGIAPDSMTYGYLMNAMLKTDRPNACLALFESACSSPKTAALTENVHLYTTAVTAASMLGDYERALELVSRMNVLGIKPNLKTLTAVMGACLSSGRADLASQLFKRIENPDGYALAQGIQALCASGKVAQAFDILKQQQRGVRAIMLGKDIMRSYHAVLQASFDQSDYGTARAALADLFNKGYIPSRSIVQAVIGTMRIKNVPGGQVNAMVDDTPRTRESFTFALFLMDCMIRRNIPVDGRLYSSTLAMASRLRRGLYRKVASFMMQAKTSFGSSGTTATKQMILSWTTTNTTTTTTEADDATGDSLAGTSRIRGWEDLFLNYDSYKESLLLTAKNGDDIAASLPPLPVRFGTRDVTSVTSRAIRRVRAS